MFVLLLTYACAFSATASSAFSFKTLFGGSDSSASQASSVDLSNGSDVKVRQPLLKATDWFLTEQEITDSRGGIPRSDLAVYTTGNAVTSLTVTKDFYDAVYEDLSKTKEGDRVLLSAYATALVPLKPDIDPTGIKTGVEKLFTDVVNRGGNVNILNWQNLKYRKFNVKARDTINKIPESPINGAKAVLLFDDRLPTIVSSYHQKTLVIAANSSSDSDEQPVAYVGGLDLANDRWDTIYHNTSAIRDASGITFMNQGWIDGHIRIHGPAAKDVANNFVARWNSDYLPSQGIKDDVLDYENPTYTGIPELNYASSNTTGNLGKQTIKNAKNFIYIEDQYFILVPELLDAIMEVMPTIQRLIVVANEQTSAFTNAGYIKYLYEMVSPIREKYPNKFKIYTTKATRKLMIHTKVVIIDDVYLSVGSANWNRRSMTSDPELNAEVVDGETVKSPEGVIVGKVPRDFRIRKFVEMTRLSYDDLDAMTFVEASDQFAVAASDTSTILDTLDIDKTKEGDRVMVSAFVTALVPLKPDVDVTGAKTGVGKVFTDIVKRGGNVNIINWSNIAYKIFATKARDLINKIPPSPINGAKAVFLFDDRLPSITSAYHQKTLVIVADSSSDSDYQPVAYVGGLDLAKERWDTIYHNNSVLRDASGITFKRKGWIDGHIRIHGPAAKDVANNFVARWNSDFLPSQGLGDDILGFENPIYEDIPPPTYKSSNTTGNLGKQSIQITRTFSCKYKHYKEFAPRGENSLFHARIKAIKNAKNFIYIEDQYFILVPELLDAIMEVMPTIQRLIVIANPETNPISKGGYIKYLYEMVSPIREKYPNNMTSDPELNAEVVDGETVKSPEGVIVGKVPRDFRIRKFVEMTRISYDELNAMTFIEAAHQLAIAATSESTILENLDIKYHAYFFAITDTVRKISDPQDTCTFSSDSTVVS
ncbi:PhosphoLipase D, Pi-sPLD-like-2 [Phytophthora palmivora]|uniref:phospholipase D n=1 Tax=Phytophthora palmivora TaxID=4796 RepID=A0A2P4YLS0_9STRA|nr:PhosphoLipase D, Pi-sPLD-like-2 [Phytophthora palmivora]